MVGCTLCNDDRMMFLGILSNLIPLFVIFGIVMLVRRARSGSPETGDASVSLRRLLEYVFLGVALILAVAGLTGLLSYLLEAVVDGTDQVDAPSWAVTSLLVGGIALWFLARNVRRRFAESPEEQASLGWVLYQGFVELAAANVVAINAVGILNWLIADGGGDDIAFDRDNLVNLLVAGALLALHVRLGDRVVAGERVRTSLVPFAASVVGLAGIAAMTGWLVATPAYMAYEAVTGYDDAGVRWSDLRDALPFVLVFGTVWWWYWLRQAVHERGTTLHHAYVLFIGVLPGLVVLVGISVALPASFINRLFDWRDGPAAEYFSFLPGMLATALVAGAVWRYHRFLLPPQEGRPRNDVDRAADHLGAWVGLCTLLVGVTIFLFVAFHHLTPVPSGAEREATMVVIIGMPLLVVGSLVWRRFWQSIQSHSGDPDEVGSVVRRTYLYIIFGISGVVALATSLFLVFQVIDQILNTSFDRQGIWDLHGPLAIALTAGVAAGCHRRVMRADQKVLDAVVPAQPPPPPPPPGRRGPGRVIVVAADPAPLAAAVEMATGAEVEMIRRSDVPPMVFDLDVARMEIAESSAATLMVVVGPDGTMLLIPVDRS